MVVSCQHTFPLRSLIGKRSSPPRASASGRSKRSSCSSSRRICTRRTRGHPDVATIIPGLTEALIRQHATPDSFQRGQEYSRGGAVLSVVRRGSVVEAKVEGSLPAPYLVRVVFDAGGISLATCTCPYDWGGWCKHIVAALLTCVRDPGAVEE